MLESKFDFSPPVIIPVSTTSDSETIFDSETISLFGEKSAGMESARRRSPSRVEPFKTTASESENNNV